MILAHDVTGSGPPMLLVGGLAFDRRCWDRTLPGLATGRTVVRSELRGSGASAEPSGPFSNVDDLARLIEFVGLGPMAVIGLSMGGGIAARLAATRPDLVSALVLVGAPSPGVPLPRDVQEGFLAVVEHGLAGDLAAARDEWMRVPFLRGCTPEVLADVRTMVDDYGGFHWRTRDPAEDARAAFRPTDIVAPTLVLWGEGEISGLQTSCRTLATAIPHAETVVVEGAGHLVPMDTPAAFVDRVTAFLARRAPAAAGQSD